MDAFWWSICRLLFWLGERSWFPFSTLRLWYWALGKYDPKYVGGYDEYGDVVPMNDGELYPIR